MRTFLIGTDWWTDCDDAAAIRLLARAALRGEIRIACFGINACMPESVSSLREFLRREGFPHPVIGIDHRATDTGGRPPYQKRLAEQSGDPFSNDRAPDAVQLYIDILRAAAEPLEIIEIGFMQVLDDVLAREPALFAAKVKKVWIMAGKWDDDPGREHNFIKTARSRAGAHHFCELCPVPVTFLGWEVGASVRIGESLPEGDVLRQVFADHGSAERGRSSWDPMLAYMALLGDEGAAGYDTVRGTASVDAETGENRFAPSPDGRHCYVVKREADVYYHDVLTQAIAAQ